MQRWSAWGGALVLAGWMACTTTPTGGGNESCTNGKDDDGDGLVDCADPACEGSSACDGSKGDGGNYGACPRCGAPCERQEQCLSVSYEGDDPLPFCAGGRCTQLHQGIDVRFEVDTQGTWAGVSAPLRTLNTRFVLKTAPDGSEVTCDTLQAAAPSKAAADANQIERSEQFNLLAYDVAPLNVTAGTVISQPFLSTGTADAFVIWTEIWSGPRDVNTRLPTGLRLGWGCFESGEAVAPLLPEHNWPLNGPTDTSRTIRVQMPAPQQ